MENKNTLFDEIPTDWELTELKDVGDFQYGYTTSAKKDKTDVKFLRITDIENDGTINWNKVPYCSVNQDVFKKYELSEGDIVFARLGATSGKTGFIGQNSLKSIFASYLIRLKVHEDINSKLIFYMAQSSIYWSQVLRQREGQLKKGMNANMLSHIKIPLPKEISEQKKIANILSTMDQAIHKSDEIIAKTELLKKGLMQELLTNGVGHDDFENSSIGKIPVDWNVITLGDVDYVTLIMGQSPPSSTYNKEGQGLPFLQGKAEFGDIYPEPILYCSEPQKIAEKNDLLLSVRAPVGEINLAAGKYCIGRGLAAIRPKNDKLNHIFLYNYIKMSARRFELLSTGSTFKAIRKKEIEKFSIPLPPITEQEKIAQILTSIDEKFHLNVKRKEKLEIIKKGLMNDLLTGRKRVQVTN